MKKIFKVFSLSILGLLLLTVLALLLVRYVFNRQLNEPLGKDKIELLKNAGEYAPDSVSYILFISKILPKHSKSVNTSD